MQEGSILQDRDRNGLYRIITLSMNSFIEIKLCLDIYVSNEKRLLVSIIQTRKAHAHVPGDVHMKITI